MKKQAIQFIDKAVDILDWVLVSVVFLSLFRDPASNWLLDNLNVDAASRFIEVADIMLYVASFLWFWAFTIKVVAKLSEFISNKKSENK